MKISRYSTGTTVTNKVITLYDSVPVYYTWSTGVSDTSNPDDEWSKRRFCVYCDTQIMPEDRRCPNCNGAVRNLVNGEV